MERKLATIEIIKDIKPIDGADSIEVATIRNWKVVVKKNEFNIGDLCVYCEIDSILPKRPEFAFLEKVNYRIKTIKLRGQISQGICFPFDILKNYYLPDNIKFGTKEDLIGMDVTDIIGVTKYEPKIPIQLAGEVKGNFPGFIPKTDEERIQNLDWTDFYSEHAQKLFYVTEKLDGTSFTCYLYENNFGVCSRNLELKEDENNTYWKTARKNDIENKLKKLGLDGIALQGEIIGPSIQKNPYKLSDIDVYFFSAFDINTQRYLTNEQFFELIEKLELKSVPIYEKEMKLFEDVNDMIEFSNNKKSILYINTDIEGLVWKYTDEDNKISFKVISNNYLLKEK